MLQSHGLREFWFITQEPEFSQIWDLCRNKANNINFHLTPNQEKSNDKIGPICNFLEKTGLCHLFSFYKYLPSCKNKTEKANEWLLIKRFN